MLPRAHQSYPIRHGRRYFIQKFCQLRDEGTISRGIRFQVSLPGTVSVIYSHVDEKYWEHVAPLYETRFLEDVQRLQELIPASDLAIQLDLAWEVAVLEYDKGNFRDPFWKPYWSNSNDILQTVIDSAYRVASTIQPTIPLGFHICYRDVRHKHFCEPHDLGLLVSVANGIIETLRSYRSVDWVHMPCPKDRTDTAYYEPLKQLFLGLVHAHDEKGTLQRIAAA